MLNDGVGKAVAILFSSNMSISSLVAFPLYFDGNEFVLLQLSSSISTMMKTSNTYVI